MKTAKKILLKSKVKRPLLTVGWREWLSLPELGILQIKAKIDSGARTSALHAFHIEPFKKQGKEFIHFKMHPLQRRTDTVIACTAAIKDIRWVVDSGGHRELRYVIETQLVVGEVTWPIEVTLTNRDTMNFRMLLGRTAMRKHLMINPAASFLLNKR